MRRIMEQLLKQLIGELQTFRGEVNARLDGFERGQAETNTRLVGLEEGQAKMNERLDSLERGQAKTNERLDSLEQGQADIKEIMKHNFTLQTENFTQIRKEIRIKNQSVQADVNLLFEEKEGIKRQVNRIEHSLGIK